MKLSGTVALVTGAAKRVGRAISLELAQAGCDVAIHYHRSKSEADELAEEVRTLGRRALLVSADLNEPGSPAAIISRVIDGLGRLDVLVNNASAFRGPVPDTVESFDWRAWESMLRTNLIAPMALCHHAQRHLEAHGRGRIVNLCDIAADRPPSALLSYSASKAGLAALTKGLARAMAPSIQVNGVAPGIAAFPTDYDDDTRRRLIDKVPLGRAGTPEQVARLVRFLVEDGEYITGQIIPIDGGRGLV